MSDSRVFPQVLKAYRMLLRYFRSRKIGAGGQVPTQVQFRQALGFSNDTLTRAMKWLVADGVIERRKGKGTVVLDLTKARLNAHTVALAAVAHNTLHHVSFDSQLFYALDSHIRQTLGAQVQIMVHRIDKHAKAVWPLHTFTGLEARVVQGEIDAVICSVATDPEAVDQLTAMGVPWLYVGSWEKAQTGVVIDQKPMMHQACEMLCQRGCERISVVVRDMKKTKSLFGYQPWKAYQQALAVYGFKTQPLLETDDISLEAGRQLGHQILQLPPDQRPQGLVILNDILASGLTDVLRDQVSYRPEIAVQANVSSMLIFGLPVIRFDVDVDLLAQQTVGLLRQKCMNPDAKSQAVQWFSPHLAHERAKDMQTPAMISIG